MTDRTTLLQMPLLAAAQAQKHVTLNESLLRLDALVQLAPKTASLSAEPGAPSDGDLYILPPGKTGAHWGAMANYALAHYRDGVWEQITPRAGFVAFVQDTGLLKYYDGAAWQALAHLTGRLAGVCDGRLTLEAGVAVSTTDQTARTTVYFTPRSGNQIGLYDGAAWSLLSFAEVSLKLTDTQTGATANGSAAVTGLADTSQLIIGMEVSGTGVPGGATIAAIVSATAIALSAAATATGAASLTFKAPANVNLDIFGFNNAGALQLEMVKWSSDTARAAALALLDGVWVKSGAPTRRLLGSVRTLAAGQSQIKFGAAAGSGQDAFFGVSNAQNRVRAHAGVRDTTDSWSYTIAAYRQARATADNRISAIFCLPEIAVSVRATALAQNSVGSTLFAAGIGVDSTSVNAAQVLQSVAPVAGLLQPSVAEYRGAPGAGFHQFNWLEYSQASGTTTWYGDANVVGLQSGIFGDLEW